MASLKGRTFTRTYSYVRCEFKLFFLVTSKCDFTGCKMLFLSFATSISFRCSLSLLLFCFVSLFLYVEVVSLFCSVRSRSRHRPRQEDARLFSELFRYECFPNLERTQLDPTGADSVQSDPIRPDVSTKLLEIHSAVQTVAYFARPRKKRGD